MAGERTSIAASIELSDMMYASNSFWPSGLVRLLWLAKKARSSCTLRNLVNVDGNVNLWTHPSSFQLKREEDSVCVSVWRGEE